MQRLLIALLVLLVPAIVIAKPKIAVAPVIGDDDGEVATAIAEVLSESAKVTSPKDTKKGMDKLDLEGELSKADGKKLAGNLKVDAVVQGKIEKDGKKKSLVLTTFQYKGGKSEQTIAYKTVDSVGKHKDDVIAAIADVEPNQHDKGDKGDGDKGDGDGDGEKRPKRPRVADGDGDGDGDGEVDGDTKVRRRRKGGDDDDQPAGRALGPALMVHAGGSFGLRRLTYDSTATNPPPPTGTVAPGARVEVELYPMAFDGKTGGAAGLGIIGDFDRAVGLAITIPGSTQTVPITQQHYSIGGRYRTAVGSAAWVGFGASFVGRMYVANRTALSDPTALDTPDVDYKAVSPHIAFGTAIASSATFFAELRPMLILSAGKIATKDQYGSGTAYGADARAGVDLSLGGSFGLRFVAEYNQVSLSFKGGNMSPTQRGVTGATDRTIALGATLAMTY